MPQYFYTDLNLYVLEHLPRISSNTDVLNLDIVTYTLLLHCTNNLHNVLFFYYAKFCFEYCFLVYVPAFSNLKFWPYSPL